MWVLILLVLVVGCQGFLHNEIPLVSPELGLMGGGSLNIINVSARSGFLLTTYSDGNNRGIIKGWSITRYVGGSGGGLRIIRVPSDINATFAALTSPSLLTPSLSAVFLFDVTAGEAVIQSTDGTLRRVTDAPWICTMGQPCAVATLDGTRQASVGCPQLAEGEDEMVVIIAKNGGFALWTTDLSRGVIGIGDTRFARFMAINGQCVVGWVSPTAFYMSSIYNLGNASAKQSLPLLCSPLIEVFQVNGAGLPGGSLLAFACGGNISLYTFEGITPISAGELVTDGYGAVSGLDVVVLAAGIVNRSTRYLTGIAVTYRSLGVPATIATFTFLSTLTEGRVCLTCMEIGRGRASAANCRNNSVPLRLGVGWVAGGGSRADPPIGVERARRWLMSGALVYSALTTECQVFLSPAAPASSGPSAMLEPSKLPFDFDWGVRLPVVRNGIGRDERRILMGGGGGGCTLLIFSNAVGEPRRRGEESLIPAGYDSYHQDVDADGRYCDSISDTFPSLLTSTPESIRFGLVAGGEAFQGVYYRQVSGYRNVLSAGEERLYACTNTTITAFDQVVGNVLWEIDVGSLSACKEQFRCECVPEFPTFTGASRDVVLFNIAGFDGSASWPIVAVLSISGEVLYVSDHSVVPAIAAACGSSAGKLGAMKEIIGVVAGGISTLGVAAIAQSKCFAVVQRAESNGAYIVRIFELIGVQTALSPFVSYGDGLLAMCGSQLMSYNMESGYQCFLLDLAGAASYSRLYPEAPLIGVSPITTVVAIGTVYANGMLITVRIDRGRLTFSAHGEWELSTNVSLPPENATGASIFSSPDGVGRGANEVHICVSAGFLLCVPASVSQPTQWIYVADLGVTGSGLFTDIAAVPHVILNAVEGPLLVRLGNGFANITRFADTRIDVQLCTALGVSGDAMLANCSRVFADSGYLTVFSTVSLACVLFMGPQSVSGTVSASLSGEFIYFRHQVGGWISLRLSTADALQSIASEGYEFCVSRGSSNFVINVQGTTLAVTQYFWDVWKVPGSRSASGAVQISRLVANWDPNFSLSQTWSIQISGPSISLMELLDAATGGERLGFIQRGKGPALVSVNFSKLARSAACQRVLVGDESFCVASVDLGVFQLSRMVEGFRVSALNFTSGTFEPTGTSYAVGFAGNKTLEASQLAHELWESGLPTIPCSPKLTKPTILVNSYCTRAPVQGGWQWVVIQGGAAQLSVTTFFLLSTVHTGVSRTFSQPMLVVGDAPEVAITQAIQSSLFAHAFPVNIPSLTPTTIQQIRSATVGDGVLTIGTDAISLDLTAEECSGIVAHIPYCRNLEQLGGKTGGHSIVDWIGSNGSNWGEGFIRAGHYIGAWNLPRAPRAGGPRTCGLVSGLCNVPCQSTLDNASEGMLYYLTWAEVLSWEPADSRVGGVSAIFPDVPSLSLDCRYEGVVTLATRWRGAEFAIINISEGSFNNPLGVSMSCLTCTYFTLRFVTPLGIEIFWLGALKAMVLCVGVNLFMGLLGGGEGRGLWLRMYTRILVFAGHLRRPYEEGSFRDIAANSVLQATATSCNLVDHLASIGRARWPNLLISSREFENFSRFYAEIIGTHADGPTRGLLWVPKIHFEGEETQGDRGPIRDLEDLHTSLLRIFQGFIAASRLCEESAGGAKTTLSQSIDEYAGLCRKYPYCLLSIAEGRDFISPSTPYHIALLVAYCGGTLVFFLDFVTRNNFTSLLDLYECVHFMMFNTTLPGVMVASAAVRSRGFTRVNDAIIVWTVVIMSPPLITHVLPAAFLYPWISIPCCLLFVISEYANQRFERLPRGWGRCARFTVRCLTWGLLGLTLSFFYNIACAQLWSLLRKDADIQGTFVQRGYFEAPWWDLQGRSLRCTVLHVGSSVANIVQSMMF